MFKRTLYINKYNIYNLFFNNIIIVIKERDNIIKEIKETSIKIWESKLYLKTKINNKKERHLSQKEILNKTKKNPYIINNDLDPFENSKIFITSFFKTLWEYPELTSEIIINSEYSTVKNNLAPFFINNFYANYLAGDFIENNLLYIITLLLQNELEKINKIEDWNLFLKNSNTEIFLTSLCEIPNIQLFFKNIIERAVEIIEKNNITDELFINEEEKWNKTGGCTKEKKYSRSVYKKIKPNDKFDLSDRNMKKINQNCQIFSNKYSVEINLSYILNYCKDKGKQEKKDDLYNYFKKIEEEIKLKNDEDLFSNKKLMSCFINSNSPIYLLSFYQNDFLKRAHFIEQLISDFENNIPLMPKFIKSICRIIILLLKNKFPNITKIEENLFLSKFLISILLKYFLISQIIML